MSIIFSSGSCLHCLYKKLPTLYLFNLGVPYGEQLQVIYRELSEKYVHTVYNLL